MDDGAVYSSPGGGYSTDKTSTQVVMQMQHLARQCRAWMDTAIENIPTLTDAYMKRWLFINSPFHFQLKIIEEGAFAFEKNSGAYLDLKTPIPNTPADVKIGAHLIEWFAPKPTEKELANLLGQAIRWSTG